MVSEMKLLLTAILLFGLSSKENFVFSSEELKECPDGFTADFHLELQEPLQNNYYIAAGQCKVPLTSTFVFWNKSMDAFVFKVFTNNASWEVSVESMLLLYRKVKVTWVWKIEQGISVYVEKYRVALQTKSRLLRTDEAIDVAGLTTLADEKSSKNSVKAISAFHLHKDTKNLKDFLTDCTVYPLLKNSINSQNTTATFNASSSASNATIHARISDLDNSSWTSGLTNDKQWLQIKFGQKLTFVAIAVQGNIVKDYYVEKFKMRFSQDGATWTDQSSSLKGNDNSVDIVVSDLQKQFEARFVRIYTQKWHRGISMRVEVFGCIKNVAENTKTTGMEVSSVAPTLSPTYTTSSVEEIAKTEVISTVSPTLSSTQSVEESMETDIEISSVASILSPTYTTSSVEEIAKTEVIFTVSPTLSSTPSVDESMETDIEISSVAPTLSSTYTTSSVEEIAKTEVISTVSPILSSTPSVDESTEAAMDTFPTTVVYNSSLSTSALALPLSTAAIDAASFWPTSSTVVEAYTAALPIPNSPPGTPTNILKNEDVFQMISGNMNALLTSVDYSRLSLNKSAHLPAILKDFIDLSKLIDALKVARDNLDVPKMQKELLTVVSSLIDKAASRSWDSSKVKASFGILLIQLVENVGYLIGKSQSHCIGNRSVISIRSSSRTTDIDIRVIKPSLFVGMLYSPFLGNNTTKLSMPQEVITAEESLSNQSTIVTVQLASTTIRKLLQTESNQINSILVSSRIFVANTSIFSNLQKPIVIEFQILSNETNGNNLCSFLDERYLAKDVSLWSGKGCVLFSKNANSVICHCYHMTTFALVTDSQNVWSKLDQNQQKVLSVISTSGSIITVICCILSILIFKFFKKLTTTVFIHINLAVSLLFTHLVFIFASHEAILYRKVLCKWTAIMLHFFLLSLFCWMLLEGIQLYFKLVKVFENRQKKRFCFAFGWGFPSIYILGFSIASSSFYERETNHPVCWISNAYIWSFLGPIIPVIVSNIFILISVVIALIKREKYRKNQVKNPKARVSVKATMMLCPILGISWIFGFFTVSKETALFMYIFNLMNSFQGLYIFISCCLLDNDVRDALKQRFSNLVWKSKPNKKTKKVAFQMDNLKNNKTAGLCKYEQKQCFLGGANITNKPMVDPDRKVQSPQDASIVPKYDDFPTPEFPVLRGRMSISGNSNTSSSSIISSNSSGSILMTVAEFTDKNFKAPYEINVQEYKVE